MRRWLPALALDRPVTVLVGFLALLVLGALSFARIPMQLMPDGFEPRFLWVWMPFPNSTPSETDELVVRPVEEQLSTLSGLARVRSRARPDSASFQLEFHASVDMAEAYNDTVDRIERAMPELPDDVERYGIFKFDPDDEPIVWAGVTFPDEVDDPYRLITKVVLPQLERVPGVASVDLWGANSQRIFVDYDRDRLISHAVGLDRVQRALQGDNFQMSGGRLTVDGEVRHVRSLAAFEGIDDLRDYPIDQRGLRLRDIADVSLRGVASADINRVNGRRAAVLAIRKESSANTVETADEAMAVLDALEADPRIAGFDFVVFFSQGEVIAESNRVLRDAALTGGLLSVLVLYAFLREWRMTTLISASIPFSLLITITVQYFRGDSINLLATMGLMLAVGMVVDNAIVVVESIYRRRADGAEIREAAIAGTAEVGLAILASTATTMVVFLPVILMTGDDNAGFFLTALGLPVVFALGASLLVALVFAPLATRYIRGGQIRPDPAWLAWLSRSYVRVLDVTLRRRFDAGVLVLLALGVTVGVAIRGVDRDTSAEGGLNDFTVRFTVPRDADYTTRNEIVRRFEELAETHREAWGVRVYRAELEADRTRGYLRVFLEDDGPMARADVIAAAKKELPRDLPGVSASLGWDGERDGQSFETSIYGEDVRVLSELAAEVVTLLDGVPGVLSAEIASDEEGLDEVRLRPDREALRRHGVSAMQVATTVAFAMRGGTLDPIGTGLDELDVETRVALEDRSDIETLLDFPVWSSSSMGLVPLRALVRVEYGKGPTSIQRQNRRTSVDVKVDLERDVSKGDIMPVIGAMLRNLELPRGYSVDHDAWADELASEDSSMGFAFVMSAAFVYLLMGVLFESWILPVSILITIPMAMAGAFWGLYLTDTSLDSMAFIGLVVLNGVVVNNGIVLVDLVTQLRDEGLDREEAILQACERRLRPILMTACTTIFGLVPMAMGSSDFVGIPYAPLGVTVIGGLSTATVLTLVFVPWLYTLLDDLRGVLARWWGFVTAPVDRAGV